jgi:hypothetical protein
VLFKIKGQDSVDHFYWQNKFDLWSSFFLLLKTLILRSFFDPEYNSDIELISEFEENKVGVKDHGSFMVWIDSFISGKNKKAEMSSLIPFNEEHIENDIHCLQNLVLNVLIQTAP